MIIKTNIQESFHVYLTGTYYKYRMSELDYPWHKPNFKLSISGRYDVQDKLSFNMDVFAIGNRYVKSNNSGHEVLDGAIDINFGAKYFYSKVLHGFIQIHNISNADYYLWNNYPMQGFKVIAGISYTFD